MNKRGVKVAVGMSGGVDSSVSALLLKQAGYDVVGLFMKLWHQPRIDRQSWLGRAQTGVETGDPCAVPAGRQGTAQNACCDDKALADAHLVAKKIGIPLYEVDARKEFKEAVTDYFIDEYKNIRTPNPCVVCNKKIKFGWLLDFAEKLGCDYLATGHYARVCCHSREACPRPRSGDGNPCSTDTKEWIPACAGMTRKEAGMTKEEICCERLPRLDYKNESMARNDKEGVGFHLLKGTDEKKDQSYFLYQLNQDQLSKIIFPVGGMTKPEVRKIAEENGLPVFEKAESQEICFVSDNDYRKFLKRNFQVHSPQSAVHSIIADPFQPGNIIDKDGNVIGTHDGLVNYTIGQRRGIAQETRDPTSLKLRGASKRQETKPKYVVGFNVEKNELIVGDDSDLFKKEFEIKDAHWINSQKYSVPSTQHSVKIRYKAEAIPCVAVIPVKTGIQAGKNIIDPRASLSSYIVEPEDDKEKNNFSVRLTAPARAITPGQSAVFYDGDEVIGGGIIV